MRTVAQASDKFLRMVALVKEQPDGELLEYQASGVKTMADRAMLRRAIAAAGRECSVVRNVGYQLADVRLAMPILSHRLRKVGRSIRRAEKSTKVISEQFFTAMPPEDQQQVLFLNAVWGTIRASTEMANKIYSPKPAAVNAQSVTRLDVAFI